MSSGQGAHRIGEFARRVGVSPELLRAWEQRYGLLEPIRSPGGFRLYGAADAERVARMRRALGDGLSAAQAARVALEGDFGPGPDHSGLPPDPRSGRAGGAMPEGQPGVAPGAEAATAIDPRLSGAARRPAPLDEAARGLLSAIESYDETEAQAVMDDFLAAHGLEAFVRDLVLPVLTEVGRRWAAGDGEISQEHFASNLIRGRLLSLARLWGRGSGPLALLACAPGERHDISLIAFGLVVRSYGWRILFLGGDTPLSTLTHAVRSTTPAAVVIVAFDPGLLAEEADALRRLAATAPVFLSGPGGPAAAARANVQQLQGDVVVAAMELVQKAGR